MGLYGVRRYHGSMRPIILVSLVAILLAVGMAKADVVYIADTKDPQTFLDIKEAGAAHGHDGRIKHFITTYETWRLRNLRCGQFGFVFPDQDRYVAIFPKSGELRARMSDSSGAGDTRVVGYPRVWRRDSRTVVVSFKRSRIEQGIDSYRWRAVTAAGEDPCPEPGSGAGYGSFLDKAPDKWNAHHSI